MVEAVDTQKANQVFIGRREVMLAALKEYNHSDHAGQTDKQKLEALMAAVDVAAKTNGRLSEDDKAKVAAEWESAIKEKAGLNTTTGEYASAQNILAFADSPEVKKLVSADLPALPTDMKLSVDLATLGVPSMDNRFQIDKDIGQENAHKLDTLTYIGAELDKLVHPPAADAKDKPAQANNVGNDSLTAELDKQKITQAQIDKKKGELEKITLSRCSLL